MFEKVRILGVHWLLYTTSDAFGLVQTFNTVNVRKYTPILLDLRTVLLDQMTAESAKAGANTRDGAGAVDLYPFFHYFTWDTITRLTFGTEAKAQTTEEGKRLAQTFDKWQQNATGMYIGKLCVGTERVPGTIC
jgi:hypothetical protein